MATVSGTFVADGASLALTGVSGVVDVSVKVKGTSRGSVSIQVSYDSGVTWDTMEGGSFGGRSGDKAIAAGSTAVQYRLVAVGVVGSIRYFLGGE